MPKDIGRLYELYKVVNCVRDIAQTLQDQQFGELEFADLVKE
jgi:hypothetical protein